MLVLAALSSALAVAVPSIPATYTADVVAVTGGTASVRSTIGRCNEFALRKFDENTLKSMLDFHTLVANPLHALTRVWCCCVGRSQGYADIQGVL